MHTATACGVRGGRAEAAWVGREREGVARVQCGERDEKEQERVAPKRPPAGLGA